MSEDRPSSKGLSIVGTGPGSREQMTLKAREAIAKSDILVGYQPYLELIEPLLEGKSVRAFAMGQERERARVAVDLAYEGRRVALVSGGDSGVYGMAGLAFECLLQRGWSQNSEPPVEVVPGITAATAAASLLGAPLMSDFAVVSLSDRYVPWDVIVRRLECAASSDMVVVLYEPSSPLRPHHIREAHEILARYREPETPVGIVRDAYRRDQEVVITSMAEMLGHRYDMRTVVIVGNSTTFSDGGVLDTPRQYLS